MANAIQRLTSLFAFLVLLSINPSIQECGKPYNASNSQMISWKIEDRIAGGTDAMPYEWPWVVALYKRSRMICAGSLVADNVVLTAAHCVYSNQIPAFYTVLVGATSLDQAKPVKVKKVLVHPLFNKVVPRAYDVALLVLAAKLKLRQNVGLICLPIAAPEIGQNCTVVGWGQLGEDEPASKKLQEVQVPIVSNAVCNNLLHYPGLIHQTMVCAGYEEGGKDSCQGDSGGPLACKTNDTWYIQGIVSWGYGCARPMRFGVYARTLVMKPWIQSRLARY